MLTPFFKALCPEHDPISWAWKHIKPESCLHAWLLLRALSVCALWQWVQFSLLLLPLFLYLEAMCVNIMFVAPAGIVPGNLGPLNVCWMNYWTMWGKLWKEFGPVDAAEWTEVWGHLFWARGRIKVGSPFWRDWDAWQVIVKAQVQGRRWDSVAEQKYHKLKMAIVNRAETP